MGIRIITLSENTAGTGEVLAERGLSILVETGEVSVLFDTGRSISAVRNADILGIDLNKVDRIVLSHGHDDHVGGLCDVLGRMQREVEVIAHPAVWEDKYARRGGGFYERIGIPFPRQELESLGANFNLTTKPVRITDSILTTGEIPMVTDYEEIGTDLFIKENTGWQPDRLLDDQALIIQTQSGLVVILGCAHRGIINTLYHVQKLTGVERIHAVIGGAHLMNAPEERLWQTIAALRELGAQRLGLCHCTGLPAACVMAQEFGESFFFNGAGTTVDLP